ncbi:hypothetical protein Tco_0112070 [Tanacetum coccineum]
MARKCTQLKRPRNAAWFKDKAMLSKAQESGQILDEEQLAFLADPCILDGQAGQTTIPNNAAFQTKDLDVYDSECDDVSNAKAVLMANLSNYGSNVISNVPHSESYHNDLDNQTVQDTNLYAQQDSMILSVIEQMSKQMINHRLNIDLSTREKMIDSQMDDMIKEKLALKQQIDSLEQNISNQIKEKESLLQTFTVYKIESKEKEMHMLTKPQVFYDDTHKQALGYQNPFYLKKAQRIKPTLYDGSVMSSNHAVIPVIDDEETLILEEVSRFKMLAKQNDLISKEKKNNTTPINYVELNQFSEDFGRRFVPQQELSAEQAFWLQTSNPNTEQSDILPVRSEAPSELPKVCLVNTSLKKLKFYLSIFDTVVKKWNTPDVITEGEWGNIQARYEPISYSLKNNRDAHEDNLKKTIENTVTIRGLVEHTRKQNPSEPLLDSACMFTKHVQELLVYVSKTCPSLTKPSEKLVDVIPINKVKKVRFSEPLTSSNNIHKQVGSSKASDSNTPVLPSTGLKSSTSASRS